MVCGGYVICVPCNVYNFSNMCPVTLILFVLTQQLCVWASVYSSTLSLTSSASLCLVSGTSPYSFVFELTLTFIYECCSIVLYIQSCCAHHLLFFLYIKHPLIRLWWWVVCSVKSSLWIGIPGIVIGILGIVYTVRTTTPEIIKCVWKYIYILLTIFILVLAMWLNTM